MLHQVVICLLICNTLIADSLPQGTLSLDNAFDNFQNAIQQQTFQSVLLSIEERLRNLDNIYSMQLSQTIESKLDQYQRKLESLDLKIIRLESMVMLNLDKISENISTKNYKDDVAITQTYRKLDNMYDGLSHRIHYMDRKSDMALDKLQNKIDTTLLRIEKLEENTMQRSSDTESELSETLFILEDLKSSTANTEKSVLQISNMLNESVFNAPITNSIDMSMQNLMQVLKQSVIQRLGKIDNTSTKCLNVTEENQNFMKLMKLELKEDFNEYANKVADMNVDIWKRNDIADESLKSIELVANSTRIEVQNGIRGLILQIGKLSGKSITDNDVSLETLKKTVNLSLEKIITNQELFLESCHRVQMDESQIESEISVMLGKLIDMLEKKMTTVMKDLKSLEKTLKNHDSRTTRNIYQANTNIVNLFEKTTKSSEFAEKELQDIKFYINSLFTFVQDELPTIIGNNHDIRGQLDELSVTITNLINSTIINDAIKWNQLERNFTKQNRLSRELNDQINNISNTLLKGEWRNYENVSNKIDTYLKDLGKITSNVNKTYFEINNEIYNKTLTSTEPITKINQSETIKKNNCTSNYGKLIDIQAEGIACNDTEDTTLNATPRPQDDKQLKQNILDIFGTPPPSYVVPTTPSVLNTTRVKPTKYKNKCLPAWANLINLRGDLNNNNEDCNQSSTGLKKRKGKIRAKSRSNDDNTEDVDYDESTNDFDSTTKDSTTTENPLESDSSTTQTPITETL